jgi:hypothetical protein
MPMKIKVIRANGEIETLSLTGKLVAIDGRHQHQLDSEGLTHFFTLDGDYDGWGGSCCCREDQAHEVVEAMENLHLETIN